MSKLVTKRECNIVMQDLLSRNNKNNLLTLIDNKKFFQDLQTNPNTWRTLKYLDSKGYIKLSQNPVSHMLLQIHITNLGMTYFEDLAESRRTKQVSWAQYIITTVIAILGLIVAILAFALELVSRLPQQ